MEVGAVVGAEVGPGASRRRCRRGARSPIARSRVAASAQRVEAQRDELRPLRGAPRAAWVTGWTPSGRPTLSIRPACPHRCPRRALAIAGAKLDRLAGQLHEGVLERGLAGSQFVEDDPADVGRERPISSASTPWTLDHVGGRRFRTPGRRGAATASPRRAACGEAGRGRRYVKLLGSAPAPRRRRSACLCRSRSGGRPSPPSRSSGVRTRRRSLPSAARPLSRFADPEDPLRVESVDRLVEHHHARIGEQRRGDPEPLAHAERKRCRARFPRDPSRRPDQARSSPRLGRGPSP